MFENQTVDIIRERILSNTDIDLYKGQGSFLYKSAQAMAIVLEEFYSALDDIPSLTIITRTHGKYLDERLKEFGFYRKEGQRAKGFVFVKGKLGTQISNGTILKAKSLDFRFIDDGEITKDNQEEGLKIMVEAVENGEEGNIEVDTKFELEEYNANIKEIVNKERFIGGIDTESDELLKERFFYFQEHKPTSGNAYHYEMWAQQIDGVKRVRVYECWNGPGTVKVVLFGDENREVSQETLEAVKLHIAEERPLCPEVTIITAQKIDVDITASILMKKGKDIDMIKLEFINNISSYFLNLRGNASYAKMFGSLASCDNVLDVSDFKVNNSTENINMTSDMIAVVRNVDLKVVEQ